TPAPPPTPPPTTPPPPSPPPSPAPGLAPVSFASASSGAGEQSGSAVIPVRREGDASAALFVDYATSDGSASSRSHYTPALGTLHFAPGETVKTFDVLITNDDTREGDMTVNLSLGNLRGGGSLASPSTAVLTIMDDD